MLRPRTAESEFGSSECLSFPLPLLYHCYCIYKVDLILSLRLVKYYTRISLTLLRPCLLSLQTFSYGITTTVRDGSTRNEDEKKQQWTEYVNKQTGKGRVCNRPPHFAAPKPNFVCLMVAANGASRPPDNPILLPSVHPIAANILNPRFSSPIFGALYGTGLLTLDEIKVYMLLTAPTLSPSLCFGTLFPFFSLSSPNSPKESPLAPFLPVLLTTL